PRWTTSPFMYPGISIRMFTCGRVLTMWDERRWKSASGWTRIKMRNSPWLPVALPWEPAAEEEMKRRECAFRRWSTRAATRKNAKQTLAACYFTMVAPTGRGDEAKSLPIPPREYKSSTEKKRYNAAIERRKAYREQIDALEDPPSKEEFHHLRTLHKAQEED